MGPSKRDNAEERLARIEMLLKQQQAKTDAQQRVSHQKSGAQPRHRHAKANLRPASKSAAKKR